MTIIIKFKNGESREFKHKPRPGGSYTNTVKYEGNFVIIVDEWENTEAFPCDTVESVKTYSDRSW